MKNLKTQSNLALRSSRTFTTSSVHISTVGAVYPSFTAVCTCGGDQRSNVLLPFNLVSSNKRKGFHTSPHLVPVKMYSNPDVNKTQIIEENRNKAGIYR